MADSAAPQPDPLLRSSLGGHLVFWSFLLVVSTGWIFWDEFIGKRGYLSYQAAFVAAYDNLLINEHVAQQAREAAAYASDEYQALQRAIDAEAAKNRDRLAEIDARTALISQQLAAINNVIKFPKGRIGALNYRIDEAEGPARERLKTLRDRIATEKKFPVDLPQLDGSTKTIEDTYANLLRKNEELRAERTELGRERAEKDSVRAQKAREQAKWVDMNMPGLTPDAIVDLRRELAGFERGIKQIHVADVGLVDRCETCHVGIRAPVEITPEKLVAAGIDEKDEAMQTMFVSHPRPGPLAGQPDLLEIHPPEQFGCSPCHNGNGAGTISTHLAHGLNKHWLWKLYEPENYEAGCQQCHEGSLHLQGAPVLNEGRWIFLNRACWGCHKREGYNREPEQLQATVVALQANRAARDEKVKEQRAVAAVLDDPDAPVAQVEKAIERANAITVELSQLETERGALRAKQRNLNFERKRQGPNLKEIKAKLRREWLVPWLKNPRAFRPSTKMPAFRLNDRQVEAIAAFVWNRALDIGVPRQPQGDPAKGRELFVQRGCMGCHRWESEYPGKGGVFAADLSRVGEKARYDYLVRWIYDPKLRLAPYSPAKKAKDGAGDVTVDDYRRAGKKPVWNRLHTDCPVTGEEMVVENQTVMPRLRLTWEEARDIASFLMTLRDPSANYGDAGFSEDPSADMLAYGEKLVKHFGCAGCHEIRGLEEEPPIGTELTKEGSKPLERLDFGLLTFDFKRGNTDTDGDGRKEKYNHKSFFMNKLWKPEIWDRGKDRTEFEALRMPNFGLSRHERVAVTTFLLGSVDSRFPERFYFSPEGPQQDIEHGWWIVKKYNCIGCHQFLPNEKPRIQTLDWFSGESIGEAPPSLVGQGFRTNPKWLAKFLDNPALTEDPAKSHRNGVREYLKVRMPTFDLTDNEIQTLVRFFAAMAKQRLPQVDPPIETLPPEGVAAAKAAFEKQVCLKCHITTGPLTDQVIAPSFVISGERLNHEWMRRWLLDPQQLAPGTKMPAGLFVRNRAQGRWVFAGDPQQWPKALQSWKGDHVDLLVRYMRQYDRIHGNGQ